MLRLLQMSESLQTIDRELITTAIDVASRAYAPYSRFHVGAALVAADGRVFTGCNVENISFGLTICAERNAVFAAVAAGCRTFDKIIIVADTEEPASPCGACRQVLAEFNPDLEIVLSNFHGKTAHFRLSELLPRPTTGILYQK
jgi:cytidine deaminase